MLLVIFIVGTWPQEKRSEHPAVEEEDGQEVPGQTSWEKALDEAAREVLEQERKRQKASKHKEKRQKRQEEKVAKAKTPAEGWPWLADIDPIGF